MLLNDNIMIRMWLVYFFLLCLRVEVLILDASNESSRNSVVSCEFNLGDPGGVRYGVVVWCLYVEGMVCSSCFRVVVSYVSLPSVKLKFLSHCNGILMSSLLVVVESVSWLLVVLDSYLVALWALSFTYNMIKVIILII